MAGWKKFTGSKEQINEMNEAKRYGWIVRFINGVESNIRYNSVDKVLNTANITEYLICQPHRHAEKIKRWVDTGQPVYCRDPVDPSGTWRRTSDLAGWYVDLEYSFNPPKEKKFIEVRDYLYETRAGDFRKRTVHKKFSDIEDPESAEGFIRWLDDDWRKVEI